MGKRFEGEEPTFTDILAAYNRLGLLHELGAPGEATAYALRHPQGEHIEFNVLPGSFSAKEIAKLRTWAA